MKAEEVGALREQTLGENREALVAAAADLRRAFERGGKLLALGNGGSATDAIDLVADLRYPPDPGWRPRPAIDLTEDTGDHHRGRQRRRHRCDLPAPGDRLRAQRATRSSRSRPAATPRNVIEALAEARRREMLTIAFVGYDGGQIAENDLADHVVITRSQHIPRIQEAQASAYHALRELIELGG